MKRMTAFLFVFLFALAGFSQKVLTHEGKVLTHAGKVLYTHVPPDQVWGLEFWFDGKDPSTVSLNEDRAIQWDDKSGHDRHVSNAVDAQRPTYDANTGRLTFTANNETYLQSADFGSLIQPNTVFIVYKSADNSVFIMDSKVSYHAFRIYLNKFDIYANVTLKDGPNTGDDNIHCGEFNGITSKYWINNIFVVGGDVGAAFLRGITLGARAVLGVFADCEIMETFGYNRVLSDTERNQLTNYLQDKWGLSMWLILLLIPNIRKKLKIAA